MLQLLRRIVFGRDPLLAAVANADAELARHILRKRMVTIVGTPRYYGDTADCIPSRDLAAQIASEAQAMDENKDIRPHAMSVNGLMCIVAFTHDRYFRRYQRILTSESDQIVAIPRYDVTGDAILSLIDGGSNIALNPDSTDQLIVSHERFADPNGE